MLTTKVWSDNEREARRRALMERIDDWILQYGPWVSGFVYLAATVVVILYI